MIVKHSTPNDLKPSVAEGLLVVAGHRIENQR